LNVGVALPQAGALGGDGLRTFATTAARLGFGSLWVGDHVVFPAAVERERYPYAAGMRSDSAFFPGEQWSEAFVTLAAAGMAAPALELGFAVLLPAMRNPVVVAKQLATLDRLSGGRVIAGMGVGWLREEYAALGVPFGERVERLVETIGVGRALWSGEPASYDGRYCRFAGMVARPSPVQGTGLRCWYGGNDLKLLERLAPHVEGWLPYEPTAELLERGRVTVGAARDRAGREDEFTFAAVTRLPLSGDGDRATALLERYAASGVQQLVVLSSVGRPLAGNLERLERLSALLARS
jgi:probable F420-dependent oxidoreductase